MKIRICLLSFFLLLFCGCAPKEPPVPVVEFSAVAVADVNSSLENPCEIHARVISAAPGVLSVTITNPPRLSGLCCRWGQEFEMSYNELSVKGESEYLPDFSFQRVIYEVLESLRKNSVCHSFEQGVATFCSNVSAGEYCVVTDSKGYIQNISVEEINLQIEFSYEQ